MNGQTFLNLTCSQVAAQKRPRWLVWENVPGVFSSNDGADFAAFLGALTGRRVSIPEGGWQNSGYCEGIAEAYGVAWRVLDAQHFGVPQRRRRVFVVGCLGDWRRAVAVLFERHSLQRHSPPSREQGQNFATPSRQSVASRGIDSERVCPTLEARTNGGGAGWGTDFLAGGGLVAGTLQASGKAAGSATQQDAESGLLLAFGGNNTSGPIEVATAVRAKGGTGHGDFESETFITADVVGTLQSGGTTNGHGAAGINNQAVAAGHIIVTAQAFRAAGQDGFTPSDVCPPIAATDGGGAGVPVCFDTTQVTHPENRSNPQPGDPCHPLAAGAHAPAIAVATFQQSSMKGRGTVGYDASGIAKPCKTQGDGQMIHHASGVRRLTPMECERLQGFPDQYTKIKWSGWRNMDASETPEECRELGMEVRRTKKGRWRVNDVDGPRYQALGNSMAVPVMRWIGERIQLVHNL